MTAKSILVCATAIMMVAGPACSKDAPSPSDAEIAHIAYTAGSLDIEAGHLALSKAQNPAVRQFAQTMVRDHRAVNDKALALLEKLGVAPQPNATSEALAAEAREQAERLQALNGAEFDRAYVLNELVFHQNVNKALETVLIPHSDNAELKSLLQTGLALFEAHQNHAEQLAADVK